MTCALYLMRIPIEAHDHGAKAQRPWVAEICGPSMKYGLERRFVNPHNDWRDAHMARSGNIYGRTAQFALRDGRLYEVGRYRGNPSKLHFVREFVRIVNRKRVAVDALKILDTIGDVGDAAAVTHTVRDDRDNPISIARVLRIGTPVPAPFVVRGNDRVFRLVEGGLYEVTNDNSRRLVEIAGGRLRERSQVEGIAWLAAHRI